MYSEAAAERAGRSAEKAIEEFESGFLASGFTENQVTRATCYTLEESSTPWGEDNRLKETGIEWFIEGAFVPSEERVARLPSGEACS